MVLDLGSAGPYTFSAFRLSASDVVSRLRVV